MGFWTVEIVEFNAKPEGSERFLPKKGCEQGRGGKTNELARKFFHQEGHKTVYFLKSLLVSKWKITERKNFLFRLEEK